MTAIPAIEVRGVTKIFADGAASVRALDGVDLTLAPGEVLILMGPSGSGKTTLLSIMGCILRPTSGSVRVRGREVSELTEAELPGVRLSHIGFVFQGFNLFPTLNAQENVELALDLKGIRGAKAAQRARDPRPGRALRQAPGVSGQPLGRPEAESRHRESARGIAGHSSRR